MTGYTAIALRRRKSRPPERRARAAEAGSGTALSVNIIARVGSELHPPAMPFVTGWLSFVPMVQPSGPDSERSVVSLHATVELVLRAGLASSTRNQ